MKKTIDDYSQGDDEEEENGDGDDNDDGMTDIVHEHKEEDWEEEPHRCKCRLRDSVTKCCLPLRVSPFIQALASHF